MNEEVLGFYIENCIRNMFIKEGIDQRVPEAQLEEDLKVATKQMLAVIEKLREKYSYAKL